MRVCNFCNKVSKEDKENMFKIHRQRRNKLRDSSFLLGLYMIFQRAGVGFEVEGLNEKGEIKSKVINIFIKEFDKNIRIFVDHLRKEMVTVRAGMILDTDWLVFVGGYSEKNNSGLILLGCEGGEVSKRISRSKNGCSGEKLQVNKLKVMHLEKLLRNLIT